MLTNKFKDGTYLIKVVFFFFKLELDPFTQLILTLVKILELADIASGYNLFQCCFFLFYPIYPTLDNIMFSSQQMEKWEES